MDYVAEVRPSWFFSVPRIWEKLQTRAEALLAEAPMYAPASLADAIEKVRLEQRGEPVPPQLASRVAEADERTFFSVRRDARPRSRELPHRRRARRRPS